MMAIQTAQMRAGLEWDREHAKRFDLVHMRYTTERRAFKDYAHGYREFIDAQRVRAQDKR